MPMLEKIKNYFRGSAYQNTQDTTIFPVWNGKKVVVDAGGDLVFLTCMEILAKNVAQIRWGLYGSDNNEVENTMAMFQKVLNLQPYPGINAYDFWRNMEVQRLAYGNAYAYICYDKASLLKCLVPLDAAQMRVYLDDANILEGRRKIIHEYTDQPTGGKFTMLPEEILHVKAFSNDGIVGRKAIAVLGDTLKSNADVESALRSNVTNGFDGTILLTYTSDLSQAKQKTLQAQVQSLLSNTANKILPLPAGMNATNIKNDIKTYYDSLKSSNAQAISAFFGIPLVLLNIGGGAGMATFSTNQLQQFYNGTIAPIVRQYSNELTTKLLTERQMNKGYRMDDASDVFDRLDAQSKATVLCAYKGAGILSANEARTSLQYPTKAGGDELVTVGTGGTPGDNAGKNGGGDTTEEG